MAVMKSVRTRSAGVVEVVEVERPSPGPGDVLVKIHACGICGTDVGYVQRGGAPFGPGGEMTFVALGHEPAGEVVETGANVIDVKVGDRVVVNPMTSATGVIGNGSPQGGMSEYLLVENAVLGKSLAVVPETLPYDVASLNEPLAVALHCVNRSEAAATDKVVVFGAGPIGLGATIWLKLRGVEHVTVVDVLPERLELATAVGADAVINSSEEDLAARLTELHGQAFNALGQPRPGTDIYIDAAGAGPVMDAVLAAAKWRAKLVIVAVQKGAVDLSPVLRSELTIVASMGYPTEIFEVTPQLAEHHERFAKLISHRVPLDEVDKAFELVMSPGAAQKVVVTL
jgi:(R,R)-butanediol dehydrogenase/meso-butanediol dehydrogenase/diacetyl reductase